MKLLLTIVILLVSIQVFSQKIECSGSIHPTSLVYVVNGVIRDHSPFPLPERVTLYHIDTLWGANATIYYGARAALGAIEVTTKKPKGYYVIFPGSGLCGMGVDAATREQFHQDWVSWDLMYNSPEKHNK